ncbi:DNA replication/repair protein RecF [Peloplasma aerotolerans]|uniref:DNA replication and repair protein RecF n=1 Tax=Peloplasma aerotolerans TaxID=3044389 RepID=A0AAW6U8C9_9MOLU|nr:DNA replication/repair protein RecF [Mariniplasma sp. M4Ah]MDI6452209.1 DNA replication/repair protein RecF [Mariniplasma sp. M4Ah]MDR4968530.1 DNA replication/repair protein RecF [Acholeplasmataceae bacterium]
MIKKLVLKNFRNHEFIELKFEKPFVYIHGINGSGKTSVLESIYFCATTKSHRTADEKELILRNEPFMQIKLTTDEDRYDIVLSKNGKRASINGVEKRKISDFIGHLRVVMFAPEDLDLIKGSPSNRRQFLDLEWMQLNKNYLKNLNTYKNVLKQRNSLLKKIGVDDDYTFLNILGEQLFEAGSEIIKERILFIEELNRYLEEIYPLFSNHKVKIIYEPDVNEKGFKNYLQKQQKQDILYQTTLSGPHRDDFYIDFNGFDAKSYASQGEQRLIVVALKLALLKLIEKKTSKQVVLLLDDVLSELDLEKQELFLKHLPKEHQILMNSALPVQGDHIQMIHLKKEI